MVILISAWDEFHGHAQTTIKAFTLGADISIMTVKHKCYEFFLYICMEKYTNISLVIDQDKACYKFTSCWGTDKFLRN